MKMLSKNLILLAVWSLFGTNAVHGQQKLQLPSWPQAQITAKIVAEDGAPIEGADVGIAFSVGVLPGQGPGTRTLEHRGLSGGDGTYTAKDECGGSAGMGVSKAGYYRTTGGLPYLFKDMKGGRWQPWNPTIELILKPILKPIPMYARRVEMLRIPEVGKAIGYDLVKSDWVAPHGKGIASDLILTLQKTFVDVEKPFDASLTITFAQKEDGIQPTIAAPNKGSQLRLPRFAPESGYMSTLVKSTSRAAPNQMIVPAGKDDYNYFFRVRTKKDGEKIISTNYGKIDRDIDFDIINSDTALLFFTYYLNPTPNDRNMEFDPKKNLLVGLKDSEAVRNP